MSTNPMTTEVALLRAMIYLREAIITGKSDPRDPRDLEALQHLRRVLDQRGEFNEPNCVYAHEVLDVWIYG